MRLPLSGLPFALLAIGGVAAFSPSPTMADSLNCGRPASSLFSSPGRALEVTFYADHASIHDQHPDTLREVPGIIEYKETGGKHLLAAQIEVRGRARFQCRPKPIRIRFESEALTRQIGAEGDPLTALEKLSRLREAEPFAKDYAQKTNLFAGLGDKIKMVNECIPHPGREWPGSIDPAIRQSMLLREFYAYQALTALSSTTLAARLARVKYISPDQTVYWSGYSFFLEPLKSVRKRCGLVKTEFDRLRADAQSIFQNELLHRFVGNDDFVPERAHNVELGQDANGKIFLFPYDFDEADFVAGRKDADFLKGDNALEKFLSQELQDDKTAAKRQLLASFLMHKPDILKIYAGSLLDNQTREMLLAALERRFSILTRLLSSP